MQNRYSAVNGVVRWKVYGIKCRKMRLGKYTKNAEFFVDG